jgi:protoheme IX farnesyltransferase
MSDAREAAIAATLGSRVWAYIVLTKPDVTFLVVITALAGYLAGARGAASPLGVFHAVFGTMLLACGTAALNQFLEREDDARMRRTSRRPLPMGVLLPGEAMAFGGTLVIAGAAYLLAASGALAAAIGLATSLSYLALYTPLKKRTTWATLVGAFPGAAPPLIGWAAARGTLDAGAWALFAVLFLWQFPHFYSIGWMYREDYSRAGIKMLPTVDPAGTATFRQIVGCAAALVPVSLLPAVLREAGLTYFFGALVLGMGLVQVGVWAAAQRNNFRARWLMHATVAYLPALLGLMLLDRLAR